jgi:uridylate kinase
LRLVIRIGGSVVASPLNADLIGKYVELLGGLRRRRHDVAVVVGGGALSRELIRAAEVLGLGQSAQDEVAISVSRVVAQLFGLRLGKLGFLPVPVTVEEAARVFERGRVVVMGGLRPGMTTDTVAALLAERVKADLLVKATDQDGVYSRDPRRFPDARKLDSVSLADLSRLFEVDKHVAGIHQIVDPNAVKILRRLRLRTVVVNGFRPENVLLAVDGERVGTLIS